MEYYMTQQNILAPLYHISVATPEGRLVQLSEYEGKVLLIVNVASYCGFTPQYQGLESLYQKFKNSGFVILAFPCNQFLRQEPDSDENIQQFCQIKYKVSFPIFAKINVNGSNAHPLYKYLKEQQPGVLKTKAIKWNFTKFLVDTKGQVVKRFAPFTSPGRIEKAVRLYFAETNPSTAS